MLNKSLFLNEKMFDTDAVKSATREGYGKALLELGRNDPNVVVLSADLTESTQSHHFAKNFPERFIECGIMEQHMAAMAAGLAICGKTVFASSYAAFSSGKNWETIRTTIAYSNTNVKIAGHHAGLMTGPDGATHQATEDIAITRVLPNFSVYVPGDSIEAEKVTKLSAQKHGPIYLRFTREKTPVITTEKTPFAGAQTFWTNDAPVATLFSTGYMTYYTLLAARDLENENIFVEVVHVPTIKPLDEKNIIQAINKSGIAISVEDHQVAGGLGSTLAELFAKKRPTKMGFIGLQDTFGESGKTDELLKKYHLDSQAIQDAVRRLIYH